MRPLRVGINGAGGRMGQRLVALIAADKQLTLAAALEVQGHPRLGEDAGIVAGAGTLGVPLTTVPKSDLDVVIDFSVPEAAPWTVKNCVERGTPLVMGTTGLESPQFDYLWKAAETIPVLWSASMSLSVNLALRLSQIAAQALADHPTGADVEIIERHHRFKEDAPSGTALKFGEVIAGVMKQTERRHGREGRLGQRPHNEIGYHAVRVGDNPGEHTVIFGLLGETLEISVKASNRDCYVYGALAAAKYIARKPAGLYSMNDVLGFV